MKFKDFRIWEKEELEKLDQLNKLEYFAYSNYYEINWEIIS